jgi:cell wall-associated NlpC family hydrolase
VTTRQRIVAAARWGIANEPRIHYGAIRPFPLTRALPLTTDCSGFVTLCYYLAGAPDPNGLAYSGRGWTGTLLEHLPETRQLRPGDVVVWGAYPGHHCALVLEPGDDPLMCSHGQEHGPLAIRLRDEGRLQPPIVTWLAGLPHRPRGAARPTS